MLKPIFFLSTTLLILGCEKSNLDSCTLTQALIAREESVIIEGINEIISELSISVTDDCHESTLKALVGHLDACPEIEARLLCTACILTLPPQSEISLTVIPEDGNPSEVIVDIRTPCEDDYLEAIDIH